MTSSLKYEVMLMAVKSSLCVIRLLSCSSCFFFLLTFEGQGVYKKEMSVDFLMSHQYNVTWDSVQTQIKKSLLNYQSEFLFTDIPWLNQIQGRIIRESLITVASIFSTAADFVTLFLAANVLLCVIGLMKQNIFQTYFLFKSSSAIS